MGDPPSHMDYNLFASGSGSMAQRSGRRRRTASSGASQPSTRVPESTPPTTPHSSTPMSIEDFISQQGRECMKRLHPDRIGGATWFGYSGNGISKSINRMLNGMIKHPYPKYSMMPLQDQELWFRQFAQDFNWDGPLTSLVRSEFHSYAATLYSRKLNEWKAKWKANEVPREMLHNETLWNGFIQHWMQQTTEAISGTNSRNRMSDRGGKGISTHNAGATSALSREEQLWTLDGVRPSHLRLIEDIHTNKKTKEIQDQVARELIEAVNQSANEYRLSQAEEGGSSNEVPLDKWNEFVIEATPKSKGRLFGLPKAYSSRSSGTSRFGDEDDIRAQLAEKTTELETLREEIQSIKEVNVEHDRRYEAMEQAQREMEAAKAEMERQTREMERKQKEMEDFMAMYRSSH